MLMLGQNERDIRLIAAKKEYNSKKWKNSKGKKYEGCYKKSNAYNLLTIMKGANNISGNTGLIRPTPLLQIKPDLKNLG